jgi:uncharacterized protein (TIGR02145 family)
VKRLESLKQVVKDKYGHLLNRPIYIVALTFSLLLSLGIMSAVSNLNHNGTASKIVSGYMGDDKDGNFEVVNSENKVEDTSTTPISTINKNFTEKTTESKNPKDPKYNKNKCTSSTIELGTQCWMKENMNVGTLINASTAQSDNSLTEKYCYDNNPNNCNTYGGLYQWNEMMQYTTTESTQGICPAGFHIPSDSEWKTLEMFLGMTQEAADQEGNRGTDQGAQMLVGGSTGLNFPIGGYAAEGSFYGINFRTWIWSSTSSSEDWAWHRGPQYGQISRDNEHKIVASPVRCIYSLNN